HPVDQAGRGREEVAPDRCRGAGRRPPRSDHRQSPARQAQAELHPARRLRRPRGRDQCRQGRPDRQQAGREDLLQAHRLPRRDQGDHRRQGARRPLPRARAREGGRADDPARPARAPADEGAAPLRRQRAPARRQPAGDARRRLAQPQEQGSQVMAPETDNAPETPETGTVTDLADLQTLPPATGEPEAPKVSNAPLREQELDAQGRAYATGRRKDAVARVWLKPGTGKITVNGRDQEVFFARPTLRLIINQPFQITGREGQYDVVCTVSGGGLSGQAGAVKHGISQALAKYEPALRPTVKAAGFLTRDSRVVERKKYGRAKARRSFQFSKR